MTKFLNPEDLDRLEENERFVTAGKVTRVLKKENSTVIGFGDHAVICFHDPRVKEGDTVRIVGRKGQKLPIAEAVKKVPEEYLELWAKEVGKEGPFVEEL